MADQFKYVKLDSRNNFEVKLRPDRINQGSKPILKKTLPVIDHQSRICAVDSIEELELFTEEHKEFLNTGDLGMVIDAVNGLMETFIWIKSTEMWKKVKQGEMRKEVVFVLGDELIEGPQYASEIWFPYEGIIENVFINLGEGTLIDTELTVGLETKDMDSIWNNIVSVKVSPSDDLENLILTTNLPIRKNKIRINLTNGNYELIKSMTVIIQIKI